MTLFHLSHTDLDGYGCQLISKIIFPNGNFYNANYGLEVKIYTEDILKEIQELPQNNNILFLITDLNLTTDESKKLNHNIKKLNQNGYNIKLQLLDHHGTGQKSADKYEWYYLNTSKSATKITYEYFSNNYLDFLVKTPKNFDLLIDAINSVDIWLEDQKLFEFGKVCMSMIAKAREISNILFTKENLEYRHYLLLAALPFIDKENGHILLDEQLYFIKKNYLSLNNTTTDTFDNTVAKLLTESLKNNKDIFTVYYKKHKGLLTYCLGGISISANEFLKQNNEYSFFIDVSRRGKASLRANNKLNVAQLAQKLGDGGGHPNASGCAFELWKEKVLYTDVKAFVQDKLDNI